ncbi:hypothetical protein JCM10207_001918 [Rhodosporidiobolus poonsookiae]
MAQTTREYTPTSLLDYTLRTAPLNTLYGTAAATACGATAGAATAVLRNVPAIPAAAQTTIRTGAFSFAFFSIREYGVIPLLTTFSLHPSPLSPSPAAPSPHTHNLLPTFLSGALAGTAFSYFQRGAAGSAATHARAGVTLALGCAVLQGVVNEMDVVRIRMLVWGEERQRAKIDPPASSADTASAPTPGTLPPPRAPVPSPTPSSSSSRAPSAAPTSSSYLTSLTTAPSPSSPHFSDPGRETFSERSDRLLGDLWGWTKRTVGAVSPVKRMEEGEYEKRLEGVLRGVEEERGRVKEERAELERLQREFEARGKR